MSASLHPSCATTAGRWALACCVLWLGCEPAAAQTSVPGCGEPEQLTRLQQRLLAKAEEGIEPLRQYVHITRRVHELDLHQVVHWIDRRRVAAAACQAAAAPSRPPSAAASAARSATQAAAQASHPK